MKILKNKSIFKKILLVIVIIILFEFSVPSNIVKADSSIGGILFNPIQSLTLAIGDVCEIILNLCSGSNTSPILKLYKNTSSSSLIVKIFSVGGLLSPNNILTKIGHKISKVGYSFTDEDFTDEIELPVLAITPDKIFKNEVPLLDANIISPNTYTDSEGNEIETPVSILQSTISTFYRILRDIAIVAFLSVLVYVGIRIVISSAAEDRAKYKQMLMDWVVGLCLLFAMHYIMSFSITLVEKITELVDVGGENVLIESEDVSLGDFDTSDADTQKIIEAYNTDENGNYVSDKLSWHTDLAGYIRFNAQSNINSNSVSIQFAYTLMYVVLVIYTLIFLFQYLKRLFNIVLLTLISPIIALEYPLDKLSDGSAQAFNMWLKEYIFNLLLQPMHLILYTVFVASAIDLVTQYPLYGIIILGCLLQAEKMIRKLFGFDKAGTMGSASSGMFTGAMVMQGINAINNRARKKEHEIGKGGSSGGSVNDSKNVRMANNRKADNSSGEDDFMTNTLGGTSSSNTEQGQLPTNNIEPTDSENNLNQGQNTNQDNLNGQTGSQIRINGNNQGQNTDQDNSNGQTDSRIRINGNNQEQNTNQDNLNGQTTPQVRLNSKESKKANKKKDKRKVKEPKAQKTSKTSKALKTAKGYIRYYAPKVAKTAVKGTGMAIVGGTASMIGVGAGLASDDAKNVATYGATAASGGAIVGNIAARGVINQVEKGPNSIAEKRQIRKEEIARETYRDDPDGYKQYLNEQSDKAFRKNKQIKQQYVEAFGESRASEMMENAIEYRRHGITDNDIIISAMKDTTGEIGKTGATDNRRIAAAKLASGVQNSKDVSNMTERLKKQGYQQDVINQNEEFVRSIKKLKYN